VILLILSAIITPDGSPITMLLMALPLLLLYEVSVFVAGIWARRERKRAAAASAEQTA
jgi:sec-independent protein translocase protein TatC